MLGKIENMYIAFYQHGSSAYYAETTTELLEMVYESGEELTDYDFYSVSNLEPLQLTLTKK